MSRAIFRILFVMFLIMFVLHSRGQYNAIEEIPDFEKLTKAEQVDLLAELCWENREKKSDTAIEYGLRGIRIAQEEGLNKKVGLLYNYVGVIYQHYKDDIHTAISYYNLGLPIILQEKDSIEIAYVYNNLGDAFSRIGNEALAVEYALKSKEIFESLQHTRGIAYSYINMGYLSRLGEEYLTALNYFRHAIDLRNTISDSVGIASANLEVARTLFLMEETDSAMHYFQKSLQRHRILDNKSYMAYSMQGIGDVYYTREQYDSAYVYFENALLLCEERNNLSGLIDSKLGLAKTLSKQGDDEACINMLNDALENAQSSEITGNILKVYKAIGAFYYQKGDYRNASESYRRYISVYDSLFSALQYETLDEVKSRFLITEQLNRVNENLKAKQRAQIFTGIIILMLLVFAIVFFLRNKIISNLSDELAESNRAKDKIFSIISHDLVSPFHVLLGASDLLMESLEEKNIENAKSNASLLQQTSEEAYRFVSNLLAWSRTQQKSIKIYREHFNFSQLVLNVRSMFNNQAKLKNIRFKVTVPDSIYVSGDRNLLQIVLVNLVNNAVKFTEENGTIELLLDKEEERVKFTVKDDGIGISAERLSMLFTEKEIESKPGTSNEKGTGFGLLLCKEFIEKHNGQIGVQSVEGEGAEFWFTLPTS